MVGYAQLLLALSILVLLHELGHFIPAKWFKMRVDKFYLFFDPWFSLFKFKKGGTEYGIGWLPLGGYVRIRGMVDESMQKGLDLPPQPWEFRAKPPWQRLIVMSGGIIVNLVLAWGIFSALTYVYGEEIIPVKNHKNGVYVDPSLREIGFQNGDKVIALDGKEIPNELTYSDISWKVLIGETKKVTVDRGGKKLDVLIPEDIGSRIMKNDKPQLFGTPYYFVIDSVVAGNYADSAGFEKGDTLLAVNNESVYSFRHGAELIMKNKSEKTDFLVSRSGIKKSLSGYVSADGKIGVSIKFDPDLYETKVTKFDVLESISQGFLISKDLFVKNAMSFKLLFNRNGAKHVGSVFGASKQYGDVWVWSRFWTITGSISVLLALLNLLPIPGLDGGHIMFTLYEMVTRKKPTVKVMQKIQTVGMLLLFSLMILAVVNDVIYGRL